MPCFRTTALKFRFHGIHDYQMEDYIQISKLNDFVFCPKSIYFHGIFESFSEKLYHDTPQTVGKIKHEIIENGKYSSLKRYLQGTEVFSEKYGLCGKIDIFDLKTGFLIERKYKIKKIYDGYRYQLYAQAFCLEELGHKVKGLLIHSLADNKRYKIPLPDQQEIKIFEKLLKEIRHFSISNLRFKPDKNKCAMCIYKPLCH